MSIQVMLFNAWKLTQGRKSPPLVFKKKKKKREGGKEKKKERRRGRKTFLFYGIK